MKFYLYLKDKWFSLLLSLIIYLLIFFLLVAFKSPKELTISVSFLLFLLLLFVVLTNFFRKKIFYDEFLSNLQFLDKKYLILETIRLPRFYEGEILYQALYEINKSMNENVKDYEFHVRDFKEYIEMWIHEVKLPLSSLTLMEHNQKEKLPKKVSDQIKRIDHYVEQVLYYVRSENAEKDYLIVKNKLEKMIRVVALKNKDILLEHGIDLIVKDVDAVVLTDSKWLEFILDQIISNSIKYTEGKEDARIKVSSQKIDNKVILSISDNGIGIPKSDLPKVFHKSFTGTNGRIQNKSTGMGLYIAKKLCDKLGHSIEIISVEGEYTTVQIIFAENAYYDVLN